jgi:antitoxin ParD1/3/4
VDISLSPDKERFIAAKIASGQYRTPAEVVEEALDLLTERDENEGQLEALLLEGIESGEPSEMTEDEWVDVRREVHQRHAARKAG